jgi:hypothetical protein
LQAQEYGPYKFDVKTRLALYTGEMRDLNQKNHAFGFGVQARRELFGPSSSVSLEVTWEHIPSMHHDVIDYAKHIYFQSAPGVPSAVTTVRDADPTKTILSLSPRTSFDNRKEQARGFSVLLGYYSKMPAGFGSDLLNQVMEKLEWFAGLRLDHFNVYSEFRWNLKNMDNYSLVLANGNLNTAQPPYYDPEPNTTPAGIMGRGSHGQFHEEGSAFTPGAFAGIKYTFSEVISFELGARYFGRKHWDFTPATYYSDAEERFLADTAEIPWKRTLGGVLKTGTTAGYGLEFALIWKL